MAFIYETHLHTAQGSACGKAPGRDYIAKYKDLGYAGIMVTDHFFHGNCLPDRSLPWQEWVNAYCRGYEDALEEGEKQGLQVFFGLEERFEWDEWLIYGLDKQYLLAHPDMRKWSRGDYLRHVREAGGCVIQCHPFRQAAYMGSGGISLCQGVDGVEVCNAGNKPEWDALAARYAGTLGPVFRSAGSDIHWPDHRLGENVFGVVFDHRLGSVQDYVQAVLQNAPHGLHIPAGRDRPCEAAPRDFGRSVTVYGRQGERTGLGLADVLR